MPVPLHHLAAPWPGGHRNRDDPKPFFSWGSSLRSTSQQRVVRDRASTNLSFLIYRYVLMEYDVGAASVAGLAAIVLANVLAFFLLRSFARNVSS